MARLSRPSGGPETVGGNRLHMSITPNIQGLIIPDVSADLIAYLDGVFPDRLNPAWDHLEFREAVGTRKVVDHLRELFAEQEKENVLRQETARG